MWMSVAQQQDSNLNDSNARQQEESHFARSGFQDRAVRRCCLLFAKEG